jgi:prepilin-type N-terminal cleavage/methylation domain-containing protein
MKKGFTLVELLAVVMIIAVLSGVAIPQYRRAIERSRATEAIAMMRTLYDSSERLAGEMGYRSYPHLYTATHTSDRTKSRVARMDMFGSGQTPKNCTLPATAQYTLKCSRFLYDVSSRDGAFIKATKQKAPYRNTILLFERSTQKLYCQNPSTSTKACDIYGLDTISGSF